MSTTCMTFGAPPCAPIASMVVHRPGDERFIPNGEFDYEKFFKGLFIGWTPTEEGGSIVKHTNGAVYRQEPGNIGKGAAGVVYKYALDENATPATICGNVPYYFALKSMTDASEEDVLKLLERKDIKIQFSTIRNVGFNRHRCFVAMPLCDGTLSNYKRAFQNDISLSNAINVMVTSLTLVSKLWAVGLSYMDFKSTNLLYVARGDEPISLILGDIGSIMEVSSNKLAISTYPYPIGFEPNPSKGIIGVPQTMEGMMWAIAITGMQLVGLKPTTYFSFDHVVKCMGQDEAAGVDDGNRSLHAEFVTDMMEWVDQLGEAPAVRAKFKDAILTLTGTTDSTYAIPVGQDPAHAVDDIILHLTACENEIDGIS